MNIHKNARLTPQGRLLLVERITEAGWSVPRAAQAAGISLRQSYRWLARYRAEGAAGLSDRSSAPHRCEKSGSQPTLRWSERDSNRWSPVRRDRAFRNHP
jgi:transposase